MSDAAPRLPDPQDMMGRVTAFPAQLRRAVEIAREGPDLMAGSSPSHVLVVGMGGSAIGGDYLKAYARAECPVSVQVVRGYELPACAATSSFAFFVSYSGDTEETLEAWDEAKRRGVPRAAVTSGGALAERAAEDGMPRLAIPGGAPPRSALALTSVPLFWAMRRAGLLPLGESDFEEAAQACRRVIDENGPNARTSPARDWAQRAAGRLPVVYAPAVPYGPVATRWRGQINENGKTLCHTALLPEQNHNEIVGWEAPSPVHGEAEVALLDCDRVHSRVRRRMEIVAETISRAGGSVTRFEPGAEGLLARMLALTTLGDLASVYLAEFVGVDPTPVASIDRLKRELAEGPKRSSTT